MIRLIFTLHIVIIRITSKHFLEKSAQKSQNIPKICPKIAEYAQKSLNMPKIYPKIPEYAQNIPKNP
jgi:hypothetical protein